MSKIIRTLVAKPGLDGHDRGAKVVARAMRDAGMEVIYTGLHATPEQIVEIAIQEDVQVIGLSILSGAHKKLVPTIMKMLNERDAGNILCVVGGIIPQADRPMLKEAGVSEIFGPGANLKEMTDYIKEAIKSND